MQRKDLSLSQPSIECETMGMKMRHDVILGIIKEGALGKE